MSIQTVTVHPLDRGHSIADILDQHAPLFRSVGSSIVTNCILERDVAIVAPSSELNLVEELAKSLQSTLWRRRIAVRLSDGISDGDWVMVIASCSSTRTRFEEMETIGTWIELSTSAERPFYTEPDTIRTPYGYRVDAINFAPSSGEALSEEELAHLPAVFALCCARIFRFCEDAPMPLHA